MTQLCVIYRNSVHLLQYIQAESKAVGKDISCKWSKESRYGYVNIRLNRL